METMGEGRRRSRLSKSLLLLLLFLFVTTSSNTSVSAGGGGEHRLGWRSRLSKSLLLLLLFLFVTTSSNTSVSAGGGGEHRLGWIPLRSACRGTIAECIAGEEFDLSSESSRRILATSGYISYEALKRGSVPCSRRGASYYNCRPGAEGNPYSRGCSAITRCRS